MEVSTRSVVSCLMVLPFMSKSMKELFFGVWTQRISCTGLGNAFNSKSISFSDTEMFGQVPQMG